MTETSSFKVITQKLGLKIGDGSKAFISITFQRESSAASLGWAQTWPEPVVWKLETELMLVGAIPFELFLNFAVCIPCFSSSSYTGSSNFGFPFLNSMVHSEDLHSPTFSYILLHSSTSFYILLHSSTFFYIFYILLHLLHSPTFSYIFSYILPANWVHAVSP